MISLQSSEPYSGKRLYMLRSLSAFASEIQSGARGKKPGRIGRSLPAVITLIASTLLCLSHLFHLTTSRFCVSTYQRGVLGLCQGRRSAGEPQAKPRTDPELYDTPPPQLVWP